MIRAILFDLDGTLLPHRFDDFLPRYFALLEREFAGVFPEGNLVGLVLASTKRMMANDGRRTNQEVFWNDFMKRVSVPKEELDLLFERFYRVDFPTLGRRIKADPAIRPMVHGLRRAGYKTALATNPVFPRRAMEERLRWAGLNASDFDLITSYEGMRYCKPHPGYFKEVGEALGEPLESCLMVGNDVELDLVPADRIGMKTYLVSNDYRVGSSGGFVPTFEGPLTDLPAALG